MSCPTKEHEKEMHRVIKWVIDHPTVGLRINPKIRRDKDGNLIWYMVGICDSTWGSKKDDGRSVTGYILYLLGVPIAWKSKGQPMVALSSSEAEYVAISELVKEILFAKQILQDFGITLELPIKIYVDNIGAIQMMRNNSVSAGTRHVNVRYHFVRELHGEVIEMYFVKTDDNESDMLTKNATQKEFEKHSPHLVAEVPPELIAKIRK